MTASSGPSTPAPSSPAAPPPPPALAPANPKEYNRLNLDYRQPMNRAPVRGTVVDFHCHLLGARHAKVWFEAADHYGIDFFCTMSPLEEAVSLQRDWGNRLHFITIPQWQNPSFDDWLRRLEMFYNLGSRIIKFHMAPSTMFSRKYSLDSPQIRQIIRQAVDRGMMIMTHVGDPDTWYSKKYTDKEKFGTREDHYKIWEAALEEFREYPWVGAHLGGNPENLERLQSLLDRFPNLSLDNSATRWMVREISARRDEARAFMIRNADRILLGTDQVSGDDRNFDFLASRFRAHRLLWESDYAGPAPILDPDLPEDQQPTLRGLSLPPDVLQKIYHDNAVKLMKRVGVTVP
jgi:predicted TIM-barrel fold metal-dependent hydrolase